ncbi:DUF397 domain-containing protein [Spirillospora sp. CA-294931]|uniref:DUF397 domain-containing protein n=1 Tax=Spirillospora sp. CA-294931 TaxID=3240042 RepID=UPI003D8FE51E
MKFSTPSPSWRKSSHSGESADCVEVAGHRTELGFCVLARDSKDPGGAFLHFSPCDWRALVFSVKAGGLDLTEN